jgi:hypothetical protein
MFVVDERDVDVEAIVAPKILRKDNVTNVKVIQPADPEQTPVVVHMSSSVTVEFLSGRTLVERELSGPAAFCVQLLRMAVSEECWDKII